MEALALLQYLWALPMTIVGLVLSLVFLPYKARWRDGALEAEVVWLPGFYGMTVGFLVLLGPGHHDATIRHEHVHVKQAKEWGPLHPIAYGLASLWVLVTGGNVYKDNVFERQARKEAGQE